VVEVLSADRQTLPKEGATGIRFTRKKLGVPDELASTSREVELQQSTNLDL
jgi:hypothetical protein